MADLGVREIEHYDRIVELQRTIESFVTDIGYDFDKFLNHSSPQKRKRKASPSKTPEVDSKILKLFNENKVSSSDVTSAFDLLPPSAKLELYSFLASNDKNHESGSNISDLEFDPDERIKVKTESQEKSKVELMKLQRDSKRRRQKFKGGKVHPGCRTIMEKHRGLVNSILEDYASEVNEASSSVPSTENALQADDKSKD